ncbi:Amidase signature enzyme [Pleurostoma richardsiae]|uniref:Amidase signature enzyme n=1 Tax=Pleurostoma richardsiae TaxID=41990 RepID=A0AA38RM18_9PEZI|nr:Amidase signature enzyme [Pleurostoma richardsiae]
MSIVSLAGGSQSTLRIDDVHRLAAELNIKISDIQDAEDFLLLLQSLESVLKHVEDSDDYIHPLLQPQPTVASRAYWRPEQKDNPLNGWSHRCELEAANLGGDSLKGRTIAIKDNISVGGLPTTVGTFPQLLSRDRILPTSPIDATVVARVLSAGALLKGTSTCENYCASPLSFSSATGPVQNPLLDGYTAGGSSSGSCVLVASHVIQPSLERWLGETAELAIGGDQAGSIRIPASYNGIYGLKPTFGLVPYTGAVSMSPMIDHLGPIASTLEDIAVLLKVMAGYDGLDSRMSPESPLPDQVKDYPRLLVKFRNTLEQKIPGEGQALKIGLLTESFSTPGLSPEVCHIVRQNAKRHFEAAGAEVVDISVPMHSEGPVIWTASTRPSMSDWLCQGKTSGYLSFLPPHVRSRWPPDQEMYELLTSTNPALVNIIFSGQFAQARFGSSVEAKAHRKVFELRAAYDRALQEVDVLVTPCAPTVAMPHPRLKEDDGNGTTIMEKLRAAVGLTSNTCPFNVTGHPALSAPCGYSTVPQHPDVRLPVGMQIVGKRWADETVLRAAAVFEHGRKLNS